jgi:hypothetical protein
MEAEMEKSNPDIIDSGSTLGWGTVVQCADGSTEVVDQEELEAAAEIFDRLVQS